MIRLAWPWLALLVASGASAQAPQGANVFGDPFVQITARMAACPVPAPPLFTAQEVRREEHGRSQRGVSCYMAGRCRLPNAYLYDQEIIPRVAIAVHAHGGFEDTSIWALGQRRIVYLKGCVQSEQQSREVEALVGRIDDVESVINQLLVGTGGRPVYELARPAR